MSDTLSEKLGNPNKKSKPKPAPSTTVSVNPDKTTDTPFETINFDDFSDFIPIENNAQDFQLSEMLRDIQHETQNHPNPPKPDQIDRQIVPATSTPGLVTPHQNDIPNMTNAQVWNVNQAQNNPFVPKMRFPNSNVTINYNFHQPK